MPQILNHLGQDAEDPAALDFGTVAVYSCSESCTPPNAYSEEKVYVQSAI